MTALQIGWPEATILGVMAFVLARAAVLHGRVSFPLYCFGVAAELGLFWWGGFFS